MGRLLLILPRTREYKEGESSAETVTHFRAELFFLSLHVIAPREKQMKRSQQRTEAEEDCAKGDKDVF